MCRCFVKTDLNLVNLLLTWKRLTKTRDNWPICSEVDFRMSSMSVYDNNFAIIYLKENTWLFIRTCLKFLHTVMTALILFEIGTAILKKTIIRNCNLISIQPYQNSLALIPKTKKNNYWIEIIAIPLNFKLLFVHYLKHLFKNTEIRSRKVKLALLFHIQKYVIVQLLLYEYL